MSWLSVCSTLGLQGMTQGTVATSFRPSSFLMTINPVLGDFYRVFSTVFLLPTAPPRALPSAVRRIT